MPDGTHNGNCANARGHRCECGGCAGALHGWQGWTDLAGSDLARAQRREQLTAALTRRRNGQMRRDQQNRGRVTDLARLDIADWLAARRGVTSDPAGTHPASSFASTERIGDGLSETPATPANSAGEPGTPVSELDLVRQLGRALAEEPWSKIKADLAEEVPDDMQIRQRLAHHTWCDLLVALIRLFEGATRVTKRFGEKAVTFVTEKIVQSSKQKYRGRVSERAVGIVVGRVFAAIKTATIAHIPLLNLLTGRHALLALRVLAVFTCPAPEDHPEVRKYALEPLASDGREILTNRVKEWLSDLLPDWSTESEEFDSASSSRKALS